MASFTTSWARDRLSETTQLLGKRVLYFDTESVIYLEEPGQPNPPLGDYLGEFTSELDDDDYIVEFVSGGPKNYGYQTKDGKVECKICGFRLNSEGKTQLIYDVMRQNVLDEIQSLKRSHANKKHQNSPVPQRRQNLRSLHLSRLQVLPTGVRQESHRSQQLSNLPLRIPSKMPRNYLIRLANTPPDQLTDQERDELNMMKTNIFEETIQQVRKLFLECFQDVQEDNTETSRPFVKPFKRYQN